MTAKTKKDNRPVVVTARDIYKDFYLPHEKNNSLKSLIVNVFKKKDKNIDIQHALRGVSFDVHEGEFFGILGRNGSGKSTLLKILSGIYQPTKGSVSHKGKLVPFIELGVGFNPELTGRENVYLNGALLGFSKKEIDARYNDIVEFAELGDFMEQKLKNYSSGMQVRLAFSVATRAEADVLLVDEVLAVGDADFQRKCYEYFMSLKNTGKTIIFVTHDMGAVREYCDRAILVEDGVISHVGAADVVADEYLKLFNETSDDIQKSSTELDRWGEGTVYLSKNWFTINDKIKISMNIKSNIDVNDVVIDFRFYNQENAVVAGASATNAICGATRGISLHKGEIKKVKFLGDNILGAGTYRLGYTIRSSDNVTIYDNNENLLTFVCNRSEDYQPIIYPVNFIEDHK